MKCQLSVLVRKRLYFIRYLNEVSRYLYMRKQSNKRSATTHQLSVLVRKRLSGGASQTSVDGPSEFRAG
jgi:hypothetical protein